LNLDWPTLHALYPRLSQVAIVGYADGRADVPGHDLTYQARCGLVSPPQLPRSFIADLAGAEQAVSAALALLLARARHGVPGYAQVALAQAAESFAKPLTYGLTVPGGVLGGGLPCYNFYRAREGWVAVAALEPHFRERLQRELNLNPELPEALSQTFLRRSAQEWEDWAVQHDLPIVAVREAAPAAKE
jgi:crotonobetainyl-CoA:carnitine CoA-transferase CaiB-like acyl-CoA transferase